MLIEQLAEANTPSPSEVVLASSPKEEEGDRDSERILALESKVKLLEKDLFYYKKTSRELRKRLQHSQSHTSGSDGSSISRGQRREDGGGREGKSKSVHSSSTEHGRHRDIASEGVTDSLEIGSASEKSLTVSGTSLITGAKRQESRSGSVGVVPSSSADNVSQAPPIAPPTSEAQQQQQQVIRKQKKQLRQLR